MVYACTRCLVDLVSSPHSGESDGVALIVLPLSDPESCSRLSRCECFDSYSALHFLLTGSILRLTSHDRTLTVAEPHSPQCKRKGQDWATQDTLDGYPQSVALGCNSKADGVLKSVVSRPLERV